jgi:hypothetical protein
VCCTPTARSPSSARTRRPGQRCSGHRRFCTPPGPLRRIPSGHRSACAIAGTSPATSTMPAPVDGLGSRGAGFGAACRRRRARVAVAPRCGGRCCANCAAPREARPVVAEVQRGRRERAVAEKVHRVTAGAAALWDSRTLRSALTSGDRRSPVIGPDRRSVAAAAVFQLAAAFARLQALPVPSG